MKALILLTTFALFSQQALSGSAYRCGNTFSQSPCGENAKELPLHSGGATTSIDLSSTCLANAKKLLQFKDPDTIRVEAATSPTAKVISYSGSEIMAYEVVLQINAKNSFGGYTGAKPYICHLSADKNRVLNFYERLDMPTR